MRCAIEPAAIGREQGSGIGTELGEATKPVTRLVVARSRLRAGLATRPQLGVRARKDRKNLKRWLRPGD
jgi:hypothetical protein